MFSDLSNTELLERTKAARRAAHDAPFAMFCTENKNGKPTGRHFLEDFTSAWADRSREWCALADEVHRRGLPQPIIDWDGDSRRK